MGIRYYAYPVAAEDIENARADPRLYMASDPLADAWGPEELRPQMLYLDKCWSALQHLLGPHDAQPPRVSLMLVDGSVTHTYDGWIPWLSVLDPDQVSEVARDLVLVDADDVLAHFGTDETRSIDTADYVKQYLEEAQRFVTQLAHEGRGLIYMIG